MISPLPKGPSGSELLRLYAELAATEGPSERDARDANTLQEAAEVRRVLELLEGLRRTVHGDRRPAENAKAAEETVRIGPFEVLGEVGRGGWGIVFRARDLRNDRAVALKLPLLEYAGHPQFGRRFLREAKLLESLDHPNLVRVYEAGEIGWVWYLALEFCEGQDLKRWLKSQGGRATPRQAAMIVAQVGRGLQHVHQRGVLHRDIKPTNILLDEAGVAVENVRAGLPFVPRLVDFGLAKPAITSGETTHDGAIIGTPAYMSPEQALGRLGDVCPASDTFALGIVLFELATGRVPFAGDNDLEIRYRVAKEPAPVLSDVDRTIPLALSAICCKALCKRRCDRYESADDLVEDLDRFLRGETVAAPVPRRPASRLSRRAVLTGMALGGVALPVAWYASNPLARKVVGVEEEKPVFVPQAVKPVDDPRLISQWVFHRAPGSGGREGRFVRPTAGQLVAKIAGQYAFVPAGRLEALDFDGESTAVYLGNIQQGPPLPVDAITAEAWVLWSDTTGFGSIIGAFQDNENYERGWVLGYQFQKFSFMLKGSGPAALMTYLTSYEPFEFGRWYHVAGTYDGRLQRLYVNGRLLGESAVQDGPILYPPRGYYTIGAYHDDDEFLPFEGRVHAVRVYNAALSPDEIAAHFQEKAQLLPDMNKTHPGGARPITSAYLWLNPPEPPGP